MNTALPASAIISNSLTSKVGDPRTAQNADEARKAAEEFEAVFLSIMIDFMWEGPSTDSDFGGGFGEDMFRSVLNQEYGKAMARSGGIGLADTIYSEILRLQEAAS